jgi:hypothetical protein
VEVVGDVKWRALLRRTRERDHAVELVASLLGPRG